MRTLTLMRHAKSSWDDPLLDDHDRPLNARGEKAARTMAKRLKAQGYEPDLVIVSSARRAQQTAEALQAPYHDTLKIRTEPRLYEAAVEDYVDVIREVGDEVKHLMLIGHNPTIEAMAAQLSGRERRMPTAAYLRVEIPVSWNTYQTAPFKELDFDYPKSER